MSGPPRRWLSGSGAHDWGEDRAYASLLDALTRDRVETEVLERQISAPAQQPAPDIKKLERAELEEARRELDAFRRALTDVRSRGLGSERSEVAFDGANSEQDAEADVLIQYLVRSEYAEVRTEEPTPGHYVYYIRVDWPRLRGLANAQGHPLPD
jgi:hypothetical protein